MDLTSSLFAAGFAAPQDNQSFMGQKKLDLLAANFASRRRQVVPMPTLNNDSGGTSLMSDLDHVLDILDSAENIVSGSTVITEFEAAHPPQQAAGVDLLLEPTPLGPKGVQVLVKELPLEATLSSNQVDILNVLNPLLPGPSAPKKPRSSKELPGSAVVTPPLSSSSFEGTDEERFRPYQSDQWKDRFQDLCDFRKKNGHCLVPHNFPENQQLAQWIKRQRYQYKLKQMNRHSTLTDERQAMLEKMGFVWDSHKAAWIERFESLKEFRAQHGHCSVPSNFGDRSLAIWVKCQRRQYKLYQQGARSTMTQERFMQLDNLGFDWNPRNL